MSYFKQRHVKMSLAGISPSNNLRLLYQNLSFYAPVTLPAKSKVKIKPALFQERKLSAVGPTKGWRKQTAAVAPGAQVKLTLTRVLTPGRVSFK